MKRYRQVRKWGNSLVLIFTKADLKDFEIEEGYEVDIDDIKVKKMKENNKHGN